MRFISSSQADSRNLALAESALRKRSRIIMISELYEMRILRVIQ